MSSLLGRLRGRREFDFASSMSDEFADLHDDHEPVISPSRHPYVERALRVADGIEAPQPPPPSFKSLIETSEETPIF